MNYSQDIAPAPPRRVRTVPIPGVRPVWTYVILAVTGLVFLGQLILGDPFTFYGLKINQNILAGEYWRLITPIFFHAGWLHFFFNMYALYIVGRQIERPLGYARFLMIYFFSGIAGGLGRHFWVDRSLGGVFIPAYAPPRSGRPLHAVQCRRHHCPQSAYQLHPGDRSLGPSRRVGDRVGARLADRSAVETRA